MRFRDKSAESLLIMNTIHKITTTWYFEISSNRHNLHCESFLSYCREHKDVFYSKTLLRSKSLIF